jgi:hypothetical protein
LDFAAGRLGLETPAKLRVPALDGDGMATHGNVDNTVRSFLLFWYNNASQ